MQPVVGIAHIIERADSVAPVQDWEAFLSAAKSMDIGIRILAQSLPEATLPFASIDFVWPSRRMWTQGTTFAFRH